MSIPRRTIMLEPEMLTVGGMLPYAVANTQHVQEQAIMAFAYRRTNGSDTLIRVVLTYPNDSGLDDLDVLVIQNVDAAGRMGGPRVLVPQTFEYVSGTIWSLGRSFKQWLADEYRGNRFVEGQSYVFNRFGITLLDSVEADVLARCLLMVKAGSDFGVRY